MSRYLRSPASSPPAHAQVKLDFENLSNPSNGNATLQGSSITQNGFTVTAQNASPIISIAPNNSNGQNYTGSIALVVGATGTNATLTQNNGNSFTLNSIDIANRYLQSSFAGGVTVVFIGSKQGGGTVTQTFTHGANNNLETVTFGSNFTNLTSVSFAQSTNEPSNQFDNIILNAPAAVPEPGSAVLLVGLGAMGAGWLVRRRKQKAVR